MKLALLLFCAGLMGLGLTLILWTQPRFLLSIPDHWIPGVLYFAETEEKLVALTIDDGPDAVTTPKILTVLDRYDAHATFFVISGHIPGNEALVETMVREGHELGNHLTEDRPSILLSPAEFEAAVLEADDLISQFGEWRWLRPAAGWYNSAMVSIAQRHNYQVVLGDLFPFDTHIASSRFAARHILQNLAPGSIVVLHDRGERGERTAATLEQVLPQISAQGYRVVTLTELFRDSQESSADRGFSLREKT